MHVTSIIKKDSPKLIFRALILSMLWAVLAGCASQQQPSFVAQDQNNTVEVATKAQIGDVLDELHAQAAAANFDAYFALYAKNAVFLGTDRSEYWPIGDFRAYAKPHFDAGNGWTYKPLNRAVHLFENTAWFEEELLSEKYGQVRGTGVLIRENQKDGERVWKVAQYNLTLPIPNSLFGDIAKEIEAHYSASPAEETGGETAINRAQPSQ